MTVDELIELLAASAGVFDAPPPRGRLGADIVHNYDAFHVGCTVVTQLD